MTDTVASDLLQTGQHHDLRQYCQATRKDRKAHLQTLARYIHCHFFGVSVLVAVPVAASYCSDRLVTFEQAEIPAIPRPLGPKSWPQISVMNAVLTTPGRSGRPPRFQGHGPPWPTMAHQPSRTRPQNKSPHANEIPLA